MGLMVYNSLSIAAVVFATIVAPEFCSVLFKSLKNTLLQKVHCLTGECDRCLINEEHDWQKVSLEIFENRTS